MIIVTGAAGFISGHLVKKLNELNYKDLVLVDDFSFENKKLNYTSAQFKLLVDRKDFIDWLNENHRMVQMVIHLGARTDTTEFNRDIFNELNLNYSKAIWHACVEFALPLIYASSAATYGLGEYGYEDNHDIVPKLKPLNPYGDSKNDFDIWALQQDKKPFFWAGLKFFNVYGPWENHKGRMASVIFHAFHQIKNNGKVKLFKSHKPEFKDGEQLRDFIYVKDVANIIVFLMENRKNSGLYNVGTGEARTFKDLVISTFTALNMEPVIEFIDTPEDIRDKYQYFTQANMQKLRSIGYTAPFYSLEDGVKDYVQNYLQPHFC
ncbi:MAG: ADP-glyceromanno-heptose 6-epimerase [Bacteroidota bacterium]|jgi:ADP-L-glycero-D-manno-heptose 6-epimerase